MQNIVGNDLVTATVYKYHTSWKHVMSAVSDICTFGASTIACAIQL
jgi:hypothetical protein